MSNETAEDVKRLANLCSRLIREGAELAAAELAMTAVDHLMSNARAAASRGRLLVRVRARAKRS